MFPTIPPLSLHGLEFIKRMQGLALAPYRDESGLRVIGYGHVLNDYESFPHFTREIAETLLIVDLLQCQRELKRRLRVTLNQAQYDALVSLAFSCGAASPALDTVLTHLNHQRFADARPRTAARRVRKIQNQSRLSFADAMKDHRRLGTILHVQPTVQRLKMGLYRAGADI